MYIHVYSLMHAFSYRRLLPLSIIILLILSNRLILQAAQPASQVRDIATTGSAAPDELTALNGVLYFVANDSVHGNELWRSDGTLTGTTLVSDIFPGSFSANPTHLTNVNGVL